MSPDPPFYQRCHGGFPPSGSILSCYCAVPPIDIRAMHLGGLGCGCAGLQMSLAGLADTNLIQLVG